MSNGPYNEAVRRRFANPLHAGDADARYARVLTGRAAESESGMSVVLAAEMNGGRIARLRFRAFGCPHLVAAAEEACSLLEGQDAQALQRFSATQCLKFLEVPVEKTGRLLLLEDAVQALARAMSARELSAPPGIDKD